MTNNITGGSINLGVQSPEQLGQQPGKLGTPGTQSPGQSSFDKVLQQQNQSPQAVPGQNQPTALQNLQNTQANAATQIQPNAPLAATENAQKSALQKTHDTSRSKISKDPTQKAVNQTEPQSGLKAVLGVWNKDQNAMNSLMKIASNNQNLSPSQMVALQAATFQVTFEMNAFGKAATEASQSLKTLMTQQV